MNEERPIMTKWRDISTAPRDGTEIWGISDNGEAFSCVFVNDKCLWTDKIITTGWAMSHRRRPLRHPMSERFYMVNLDTWHPLPEAPKREEEG